MMNYFELTARRALRDGHDDYRGWTGFDGDREAARGMPRGRSS